MHFFLSRCPFYSLKTGDNSAYFHLFRSVLSSMAANRGGYDRGKACEKIVGAICKRQFPF